MPFRRWTTVRQRFISMMVAVAVAFVTMVVGSYVAPTSVRAIAAQAVVNMPFSGQWAYNANVNPPYTDNNSSHPSVHWTNATTQYLWGDWATDIYPPNSTTDSGGEAVTLNVTSPDGPVTFTYHSSNDTCGANVAGHGIVLNVLVNNVVVGLVDYEHLDSIASTYTNGQPIGYITKESLDSGCYTVRHVHIELKDAATTPTTYACWVDHGHPGVSLNQGDNLGVLGSANTAIRQACTSVPSGGSWPGVGNAIYSGGDSMASGTTLLPGYYLTSFNVQYALVFTVPDDNLVLYGNNGTVLWQSHTSGQNANRAVMQTDGNLVMYRADNSVVFTSGTGGYPGAYANLQNDGNFVVRDAGAAYWQSQSGGHANLSYFGSDRLLAGQQLVQNQYLRSTDGRYALLLLVNGDAVLYGPGYHVLWETHTTGAGDRYTMQPDGNLVLYALNVWQWQSYTTGTNNWAVLQPDGNFVVYRSDGFPLWPSGTGGKV